MKFLIKIALNVFALFVVGYLVPGFYFSDFTATLVAAVVIGVVNTFIKPVLQIIFIPLTIITLGVSAFLINVFLLWGVSFVVPGFEIDGFMSAVIGSLVLSLVSLFLNKLAEDKKEV